MAPAALQSGSPCEHCGNVTSLADATITATIPYVLYTQVPAMDVVAAMAVAEVQLAATTIWR